MRQINFFFRLSGARWVGSLTCALACSQVHLNDNSVLSVVNYAVVHLGVKHGSFTLVSQVRCRPIRHLSLVIVVGHTNCGGAKACVEAAILPPEPPTTPLSHWLAPLTDLARKLDVGSMSPEKRLPLLVRENVRRQVQNLAKTEAGKVHIHGWEYDLRTGLLADLGMTHTPGH